MIKLKGLSQKEVEDLLPDGLVYLAYRGSITHGTYRPSKHPNSIDDKDLIGVYVAPVEHYLGFGRKDTYEKTYKEWDCVFYEFRKMLYLLKKSNPNVLSCLWLPEKHVLHTSRMWEGVLKYRDWFVSKQAYHAFSGYAHSQLKRMTHLACEGYMGEKRKQLVAKHGYDTKNAAHLIRLLQMGIEFLTEGRLYVERKNASELLAIKDGAYSLEAVKEKAERLFKLAEEAYVNSSLPSEPNELIETLCVNCIRDALKKGTHV
jgi:predicted nucleotidyltransferase